MSVYPRALSGSLFPLYCVGYEVHKLRSTDRPNSTVRLTNSVPSSVRGVDFNPHSLPVPTPLPGGLGLYSRVPINSSSFCQ